MFLTSILSRYHSLPLKPGLAASDKLVGEFVKMFLARKYSVLRSASYKMGASLLNLLKRGYFYSLKLIPSHSLVYEKVDVLERLPVEYKL